jgi:hypothetical protein
MRRSVQITSKSMRRLVVLSSARSTRQGGLQRKGCGEQGFGAQAHGGTGWLLIGIEKAPVSTDSRHSPRTGAECQVPCKSALSQLTGARTTASWMHDLNLHTHRFAILERLSKLALPDSH